jgi:hypothetical protein
MRFFIFFVCLNIFSKEVQGSYVILSASLSGHYWILENTSNSEKVLIDYKRAKVICEIDSALTPILWIKDSIILFQRNSSGKLSLLSYGISKGEFRSVRTMESSNKINLAENADFVSFPNNIQNIENAFFVYIENQKLYKYTFNDQRSVELFHFNFKKDEKINNISINNRCTKLLLALRMRSRGEVLLVNLDSKKTEFVRESRALNDESSCAYFLQNDNEALIYNVIKKYDRLRIIRVDLFNSSRKSTLAVSYIKCVSLANPIKIYSKNIYFINAVSAFNLEVQIQNSFLEELVKALANSLGFIEIKPPFNRVRRF